MARYISLAVALVLSGSPTALANRKKSGPGTPLGASEAKTSGSPASAFLGVQPTQADIQEDPQGVNDTTLPGEKDFGDVVVDTVHTVGQVKDAVLDNAVGVADGIVRIAHKFNLDLMGAEKDCIADRTESLGCFSDCECGWRHKCFTRYMLVDDGKGNTEGFNVGVCDVDMRVMLTGSITFFSLFWLGGLVFMRLKFPLQRKEFFQTVQWDEVIRTAFNGGDPFRRGGVGAVDGQLSGASGSSGVQRDGLEGNSPVPIPVQFPAPEDSLGAARVDDAAKRYSRPTQNPPALTTATAP